MNGMSATTSARAVPRTTAFTWWSMSSIVTGMVVSYPNTTIPSVSPTRMSRTPASSTSRAEGQSYAVIIRMRSPLRFIALISLTVVRGSLFIITISSVARALRGDRLRARRDAVTRPDDAVSFVDVDDARLQPARLLVRHHVVAQDDDGVALVNQARGRAVDHYLPGAGRALDDIRLEPRAGVHVQQVDLLVRQEAGRLHEDGVHRHAPFVVEVGVGDPRPVYLALEHRPHQLVPRIKKPFRSAPAAERAQHPVLHLRRLGPMDPSSDVSLAIDACSTP